MGLNETNGNFNASRDTGAGAVDSSGDVIWQQCQRILACTARALAASPGGLRFKAGSRPWLDGLEITPAQPSAAGNTATAARTVRPPKAPFFGAFFHAATPVRHAPAQGA